MIELPEDRLICSLKAFIINSSWKMRNTGAIYLYILAIQKGLKFFEDYLEQSFLILLTDPSKYYLFLFFKNCNDYFCITRLEYLYKTKIVSYYNIYNSYNDLSKIFNIF